MSWKKILKQERPPPPPPPKGRIEEYSHTITPPPPPPKAKVEEFLQTKVYPRFEAGQLMLDFNHLGDKDAYKLLNDLHKASDETFKFVIGTWQNKNVYAREYTQGGYNVYPEGEQS